MAILVCSSDRVFCGISILVTPVANFVEDS